MTILVGPRPAARRPGSTVIRSAGGTVTLAKLFSQPHMRLLVKVSRTMVVPTYRIAFLTAAAGSGVLRLLATEPRDASGLAEQLDIKDERKLAVWLEFGVRLGQLGERGGRYQLKSRAARFLADPRYELLAFGLEEVMRFNMPALLEAPRMLRTGRQFSLADHDPTVVARTGLAVQQLVERAVAAEVDRTGPFRVLELGCGHGMYACYAAQLNPRVSVLAVDLDPGVAEMAEQNIRKRKLSDRIEVRQADLRSLELEPAFDLITMHNNICAFPEPERAELFRHVRSMLAPGGKLLVTSLCQGCNVTVEVVNLWLELADFGGALPRQERLCEQLREAGFAQVTSYRVVPGEEFRAFTGVNA